MTRTYSSFNTDLSKAQLARLADKETAPDKYQEAMTLLGERLGEVVSSEIRDSSASLYLACTAEDAVTSGLMQVKSFLELVAWYTNVSA